MNIAFFDQEILFDEQQTKITELALTLTERAFTKRNPCVQRNASRKRINEIVPLTKSIIVNLVCNYDKEILIEFYQKSFPKNETYQKIIKYLQYIGFIDIYEAPSYIDFQKLHPSEKSQHIIPRSKKGKRRLSSIKCTEKGITQLSQLNPSKENQLFEKYGIFGDIIRLQRKIGDNDYQVYPIAENARDKLTGRFEDLVAYRQQVPSYNATFHDQRLSIERPLVDLPHMVYSHREGHNFNRGGRISYLANQINSEYRSSIKFNGKPTVELDFKCSLPSILFGMAGKSVNDFYDYKGFGQEYRSMFKLITVCIIGAKSKGTVRQAVVAKLNDNWYKMENGEKYRQFWPPGQTKDEALADIKHCCGRAVEAFESIPLVKEKLFRGEDVVSLELQFIESLIAWDVINNFVSLQKPILCIHDSFIVLTEDEKTLRESMTEAYQEHVGCPPLKID